MVLKLIKVHQVIEFDQEAWLKEYINFNTELRKKAINDFKTEDFYKDISENIIERFDTSNYTHDKPLPIGVNEKVLGLMKDELGGGIFTEFVALRPKAYSYKTEDNIELKKAKGTKKCIINKMLSYNDYKKCLFDNGKVLRSQQRFKSENHIVYTENINKIALSCDDDKRFVATDGIEIYPYGYVLKKKKKTD